MKVYILFRDLYEGREVAGIYRTLEEAQAGLGPWRQDEPYSYEVGPSSWRSAAPGSEANIEEHELAE